MEQHVNILFWYKHQATSNFVFISHIEHPFYQSINKNPTLLAKFKKGIFHE